MNQDITTVGERRSLRRWPKTWLGERMGLVHIQESCSWPGSMEMSEEGLQTTFLVGHQAGPTP